MTTTTTKLILDGDPSGLVAAMNRAHGATVQAEDRFQSIGRSVGGMALSMGLSLTAVVGLGRELVSAGLAAEKLNMQFRASAGSTVAANRELAYVRNLSNDLGLSFQDTATAYGKFLAATRNTAIEGQAAQKVFEGVSEAATALGLTADESSGIFLALSQMMSKGKVSAEELTGQLGERLPGALKLAADAMGLTTAELMKQMQEGKIMSADLLPKLAAELHKTYGTAAQEAASKGQAGINRFNNEVRETISLLGSKLLPLVNAFADSQAKAIKEWRESLNRKDPFWDRPGYVTLGEKFSLPGAGQDTSFAARNRRFAPTPQPNGYGLTATGAADPQAARAEYERNQRQAAENERRAAAEKAAAGASEKEKAAKTRAIQEKAERAEAMKIGEEMLDAYYKDYERRIKEAWDVGAGMVQAFHQNFGEITDETATRSRWAGMRADSERQAQDAANGFSSAGDPLAAQVMQIQQEEEYWIQHWAMLADSEDEYERRRLIIQRYYDQQRMNATVAGAKNRADFEAASNQQRLSMIASAGVQMTNAVANSNKGMFLANKAFRMIEAGMELKAGIIKTWNSWPYPYNIPMTALHTAAGVMQLADLASAGYGGSGGSPGGNYGAGTPTSPVITQATNGTPTQQQGDVVVVLKGTPMGKWIEEELVPGLKEAGTRNVRIEYSN